MERTPGMLSKLLLSLLMVLTGTAYAQTREQANEELQAVQGQIQELRADLEKQGRRKSRAERELAEVEQSERRARNELTKVRKQIAGSRRRQSELEQQLADQRAELAAERAALARQLRVAYINGSEEWLRVALNQQDATGLGRRMTYYGYLSRQRSATIAAVAAVLNSLETTRAEIERELARLADYEAEAADTLENIADMRGERAGLLARINDDIRSKDAEIERLQAQAAELTELVEALARVLPQMPALDAAPFAGQADSLAWPAKGPVLKNFGQSRADGRLRWKGVLLGAEAGSTVRAIYHGRVVFSDWLDGMGLLAIIDHGDGYMSLYGHNQDLLKEVGEWVGPGDSIAHVGDSGGQAAAGLYFEIRKDGQPVDPGRWIR
jgi:septal ring factor EnvC (AmiA/AmiB activator)